MHFLIQANQKNELIHDFAFQLRNSLEFLKWKEFDSPHTYSKLTSLKDIGTTNIKNSIPVGSLDFVFQYMKYEGFNTVHKVIPLNVPTVLQLPQFLNRQYEPCIKVKYLRNRKWDRAQFVKEASIYKGFTDIVSNAEDLVGLDNETNVIVSEVMDFEDEWRFFVQSHEIVGAQPYIRSSMLPGQPDFGLVKEMVRTIEHNHPIYRRDFPSAYTLDVGVSNGKTSIIEVHPFVSCGLYGFQDIARLTTMFIQGYNFFKIQATKGDAYDK